MNDAASAPIDARYTLDAFVQKTMERELRQGLFELESERILDINLDGEVWIKTGAMIAYTGQVKFVREKLLDRGHGKPAQVGRGRRGRTADQSHRQRVGFLRRHRQENHRAATAGRSGLRERQ